MNEDDAMWQSYVAATRNKYINFYAAFAQQHTNDYQRLEEELPNMMNAVRQTVNQRAYQAALDMAEWLWNGGGQFLDLRGHVQEGSQLLTEAAKAAQLLGDERQEERLLGQLGRASMALRNWPEASKYLGRAFVIAHEVGDLQGKASHLGNLGQIQLELKKPQEAASHFQDALRIAKSIPDPQMVGRLQASLGLAKLRSQMETGYSWDRMREVIELFQTALKIARETDDRRGEASHFGCLGNAYELMGSMNVSLPPFVGGSPYPMDEENRRTRYREDLERANQESYLEAFEYYSAAFSTTSQIGDVPARASFQADLWRTGRLAGLDMMSGGGVNWNTWMRNHPDKPVPGFRYRK